MTTSPLQNADASLLEGHPAVLMVSGGSDSTALAYWAAGLRDTGLVKHLAMLHVNHQLRGADADADEAFVRSLAALLDIPLTCDVVDVAARAQAEGGNVEAVARRIRYEAARNVLEQLCATCSVSSEEGRIVTAHTADDRAENFYMRSIVGTGPGGFRSMDACVALPSGAHVVRPLLHVSRDELRDYLGERAARDLPCARDERGHLWRNDATNDATDRFRTFVRHEIIPKAKERNPRLLETLTRTMDLIAAEDDFLHELATAATRAHVSRDDNARLLAPTFGQEPLVIQRRVVFALLENMLRELVSPDARVENASVEAVLAAFENGSPVSGYTTNIQGNLAVSANKRGVRIEPMEDYRARRRRI